jgi:hypothetical protein
MIMDKWTKNKSGSTSAIAEKTGLMQKELFHIWCFLSSEGLNEEAVEYLREHFNDPVPFYLQN